MKNTYNIRFCNKVMIKIFVSYTFIIILLSCESLLKENSLSLAVANEYYSTKVGIDDGLKAAYPPLRNFYGTEAGIVLTELGTDIFTNGFGGEKNYPSFNHYDQNLLGTHGFFNFWNNFYEGINQCNTIVERTPDVDDMTENEKRVAIGEARFLRALYYFHLVQQFGDVHFSLEETIGVETEANRTPVNTIYQEGIVPDLEFAIANLPIEADNYGRATKPAAEALLARVQLTLGNWKEAETMAYNVINNYNFSLVTPYSELWKIENEVNEEIIWSVQYTTDPLTNGSGNNTHMYFIPYYFRNPALDQSIKYGRCWQRFMATNYFLDLWDFESDLRWEHSFIRVWIANRKATINGHIVNPGDTAMKIVMHPVDDAIKASAPYWYIDYRGENVSSQKDPLQIGGSDRMTYPGLWKFYDDKRPEIMSMDGSRDYVVIRLAEMYLIVAEAAHNQGKNSIAVEYINKLRERVIKPGKEEQMLVNVEDINLDFILEERARELCGEMHRWYDLKRTGTLLDRVRKYNDDAAPNIQEMHLVRPIPQTQVDRVTNPGEFTQNPGY